MLIGVRKYYAEYYAEYFHMPGTWGLQQIHRICSPQVGPVRNLSHHVKAEHNGFWQCIFLLKILTLRLLGE